MFKSLTVLGKRPNENFIPITFDDIKSIFDFIDGGLETVPLVFHGFPTGYSVVCNDNFLSNGSVHNLKLSDIDFFGNIFITKIDFVNSLGEKDFVSLSESDIRLLLAPVFGGCNA